MLHVLPTLMPYKSLKQAAFFHANKDKLEKQGVDVGEWDSATDFSTLPERKPSLRKSAKKVLKHG